MPGKFDPSKPIDDETVWFPRGMLIKKDTKKLTPVPYDPDFKDDDDTIFILERGQMHALCRFLWTGKLLPTSRTSYVRYLGLVDTDVISDEVWAEIDKLIKTYTKISDDCTDFKDNTWDKLTVLATDIKTYAHMAGGTDKSSYYQATLQWIGEYAEEQKKPKPDWKKLDEYAANIKDMIESEQRKIKLIQDRVTKALEALATFHDHCKDYEVTLQGDEKALQGLLDKEGNNVDSLQARIDRDKADIADAQSRIDADHATIRETNYYSWVIPIGTIVAAFISDSAEKDIERLEAKIKDILEALEADEAKLQAAKTLQADITCMRGQVTELISIITPAIKTLEALQGAWTDMNADLQTVYDLFVESGTSVPSVALGEVQFASIREAWNHLKELAGTYIQNSFMTTEPQKQTLQQWLDDAQKYLAEAKRLRANNTI